MKKLLGFWLMPLSFCLAFMVLGLCLTRFKKWARLGQAMLVSALVLLILFSNDRVSRWLIRPLEQRYPAIPEITQGAAVPAPLASCQYIVVLGGGNGHSPGMAANNLLAPGSLARIVEGVRLLRMVPDAKLVVCGPGDGKRATHATVLARTAISLGVPADRIVYIEHARDTEEEAMAAQKLVGDAKIALVTSAWHMPRSVALFRSVGLDPLPCPADFTSHTDDPFHFEDLFWEIGALQRSTWAVRERIGYLWITLRGKT